MPQALPVVWAIVGKFVVSTIARVVITLVVTYALGRIQSSMAGRAHRSAALNTHRVMVRSTVGPREIVYGEVRKSGSVVFYGASGNENQYIWYVVAVAGHQCEAITDVWFDNQIIADADINATTGEVTGGKYAGGKVYIWKKLGTSAQTVHAELDAAFSVWTTSHKLKGIAYAVIRLERDEDLFAQGAPNSFFFKVKGKRVYDPRLDSTNGGSGAHRLTDATTWAWSDCSALCAADYMTGGSLWFDTATPDNRLGVRVPTSRIDWPDLADSANECDELVSIPGSTTQKRYTCNGILSTSYTHEDNFSDLLATMIGQRVYTGDKYRILAGRYDAPTHTFTDSDLSGGWELTGCTEGKELYNAVAAIYWDPDRDYAETTARVRVDSAYETADGGQKLRTIRLDMVTNEYRSQRISEVHKRASRDQAIVKCSFGISALKVSAYETLQLSFAEMPSWMTGKVWRAQEIELDLSNPPRVIITAKVETASGWTEPAAGDYLTPNTGSPSAQFESPSPPGELTVVSIQDGISFHWDPAPGFLARWRYELWEYTAATPFSSATKIWEGVATRVHVAKQDTTTRYYWIRVRAGRNATGAQIYSDTTPGTAGAAGKAAAITTGFRATASVSSLGKVGTTSSLTTGNVTATPVNGATPFTYAWTWASGGTGLTITASTSATTAVSATGLAVDETRTGVLRCTITDNAAATATVDVSVQITRVDYT